ncbi:MAG TPA: Rieske 2Fe-2S domain-containing protein [Candidatus Nanoarchaeia archaeon]|nr:Rieske 2Fe-2S domain-containing protein [Candidatus Nanoarchaeia archaeon]
MVLVKGCGKDDLARGAMKAVNRGGLDLVVIHMKDDNFYCVRDECTHHQARLSEGFLRERSITCPFHAAQFDVRTGKASFAMPIPEVRTFPVAVGGEDIFVEI